MNDEEREVVSRYTPLVINTVKNFVFRNSCVDSDDLQQVAFLWLCKQAPRILKGEKIKLRNGIYRSLIDHIRQQTKYRPRHKTPKVSISIEEMQHDCSMSYTINLDPIFLDDIISSLSLQQRKVVSYLRDGFNMKDTGELLGMTEGRVSQIFSEVKEYANESV